MKKEIIFAMTMLTSLFAHAQQGNGAKQPIYLDPKAVLEERVEDVLARMTTHEKVQILHAQSKFTSAGVPRLGI